MDYKNWKESPVIHGNEDRLRVEVTKIIAWYFAWKNISAQAENIAIIRDAVFDFCNRHQTFKIMDLESAIELGKVNEEYNISAAHVVGLMNKYLRSDKWKQMFTMYQDDQSDKVSAPAPAVVNDLEFALNHFRAKGEVWLSNGKVYVENYFKIRESLGEIRLRELAQETYHAERKKLIDSQGTKMNMAGRHEVQSLIDRIDTEWNTYLKDGRFTMGGVLKNEVRKSHLAEWFKQLETQPA